MKPVDNIERNLACFGIDDIKVEAEVEITRFGILVRNETVRSRLSAICARHREVITEVSYDPGNWEKSNIGFRIRNGVVLLGFINDFGHFYYERATSVKLALGWLMATSLGRGRDLSDYKLDRAVGKIRDAFRKEVLTEAFLRDVLLYNQGNSGVSPSRARTMFMSVCAHDR
ncbi:MAG: hypothetical protein A2301_04150 [Candidatus Magasanikbacteria bacterium RIFOXYB2_FULL_40_13]|nr:MAG: hypothetical protein A2301_04150 [Candidatus Magasanikbacteria bacterium RIFOXYB2_FULL_40_13]